MLTKEEFYDDNTHRYYPFYDAIDVKAIPTSIIVDAHLLVSDDISYANLNIDQITITDRYIRITVSVDGKDIGILLSSAIPSQDYQTLSCSLVDDATHSIIEGSITFGLVEDIKNNTGIYSGGKLFPTCVTQVTEWCTGLVVNGRLYTGMVTIEASDGVSIETTDNSIMFKAVNYSLPEENNDLIQTKEALITEIKNKYGQPIVSINGVPPNSKGNIVLAVEDPLVLNSAEASITISDNEGSYCEDAPIITDSITTQIELLFDNVTALNERAGALDQTVQAIDNNVNILSAQMARVSQE